MNEHIKRAIDIKGGGTALALAIGRSPQFVSQLLKGDRPVPAELCPLIERTTREDAPAKGLDPVTCEQLRPDVQWGVLRERTAASGARERVDAPVAADRPAFYLHGDRRRESKPVAIDRRRPSPRPASEKGDRPGNHREGR